MVTTVHDDLLAPEVIADPFAYFGRLREEDPVHWNERYQVWVVTRYDDVVWLARHQEVFSSENLKRDTHHPYPPIQEKDLAHFEFVKSYRMHELIQVDPPDHTRLRGALHKSFTPKLMEQWRARIQSASTELLDEVQSKGQMDVMEDFAVPLPLLVISQLLGIPMEERKYLRSVAKKRMQLTRISPDRMRHSAEGVKELTGYLAPMLDRRMAAPQDDLLTLLATSEKQGTYTRTEALANAMILIDAGHETTINLICNGTLAFIRNRDQWDLLRRAPSLIAKATQECLRYDPPVKMLDRVAAEDVELQGKKIRKDDRVQWVVSAANHDPRAFPNPDAFEIARWPNHHITFGSGIHYCLGQYLARLEGQEAFRALAERFPTLRLETDAIEYAPTYRLRTVKALPLTWS